MINTTAGDFDQLGVDFINKVRSHKNTSNPDYDDAALSTALLGQSIPYIRNRIKEFGKEINSELSSNSGSFGAMIANPPSTSKIGWTKERGYGSNGLTFLINDTAYNGYYLHGTPSVNTGNGEWTAQIYVEVIDHFGLDNNDLFKFEDMPLLGKGFTSWWLLHHVHGYVPFRSKMRFLFEISRDYIP